MNADPHRNSSVIYMDAIRDLNLIRDDIASFARAASNGAQVPYRARLLQAKEMMSLVSFFNGSWTDAYCAVQRECSAEEKPSAEAVEVNYSKRLIEKLEAIVETAWVRFGDRNGEKAIRATKNAFEAEIAVVAARYVHESLAAYAESYIARLRDRLAEFEVGVLPKP